MPSDSKAFRLAIFGSGGGSNAEAIIEYFKDASEIQVGLVVTNRKNAFILERAANHQIPAFHLSKKNFANSKEVLELLSVHEIDMIILAGFLLLIPSYLIQVFPNKILNIHPALLPKYGGKGMYGHHVHEAVHAAKEKESGITIHYVNEQYDDGNIIAQFSTSLDPKLSPEEIAAKVLKLEHTHYPNVIADEIQKYLL